MSIPVERLTALAELFECEKLQERLLGQGARSILTVPILAAIQRSGGLLLGAWEGDEPRRALRGALVDVVAKADEYPALFTVFLGVEPGSANRGIAQSLRMMERSSCAIAGVDLVYWWSDPLHSTESHIAFNKLGAIASAHSRNALGPLDDDVNVGLATDRFRIEWWIDSPRVSGILDGGRRPPHFRLGFDQMQVITQTRGRASGLRRLAGLKGSPSERFVLVEIPVDFAQLRNEDAAAAKEWRLVTREAFELLFADGYTIVGFIHEGGRSFHLFEREDRGSILGRP